MHSANNSNTFLAYFNQIDKYLSYILWLKKYVPYHERITMLLTKKTKIRSFVNKFESKLRYFGDLRNHLVHGFRLDNRHYIHVSEHAVKQITFAHDQLTKPQTLLDGAIWLESKVIFAQLADPLNEVLELMKQQNIQYLPVYQDQLFLWILSFRDMLARLVHEKIVDTNTMTIEDVDISYATEYVFVESGTSVYDLPEIFSGKDSTEIVIATDTGSEDEKIQAMLSVHDAMRLQSTQEIPKKKQTIKTK